MCGVNHGGDGLNMGTKHAQVCMDLEGMARRYGVSGRLLTLIDHRPALP